MKNWKFPFIGFVVMTIDIRSYYLIYKLDDFEDMLFGIPLNDDNTISTCIRATGTVAFGYEYSFVLPPEIINKL